MTDIDRKQNTLAGKLGYLQIIYEIKADLSATYQTYQHLIVALRESETFYKKEGTFLCLRLSIARIRMFEI